MYAFLSRRFTARIIIALTICVALLPVPGLSFLISGVAENQREVRKGKPKPGKPEGELPNLEEVKEESDIERNVTPPMPSTVRSRKNSGEPWDGRRVGDTEAPRDRAEPGNAGSISKSNPTVDSRRNQIRRAHARTRIAAPPLLVPEVQFKQNFFTWALLRSPYSNETTYWDDQLRVAHGQGQGSLKLAAIELGRTLFESAEYAARSRNPHDYVYDLYKTYLMRDPDSGGWAAWEGLVSTHGREYVRRGFEESGEFTTVIANMTLSGSPTGNAASLITAQVDPRNQPGRGMLTRDANWSLALLSLPGRAGLDLGLGLSYSSQVWTRSGPYIYFDEDNSFPSPGFRLGFPSVQRKVFDSQTARNAYLLITAAGRRVELRQVGASNIYDAADSSYLRLTDNGSTLLVHSTDGTKLSYSEINGEWRCVEIKDRNGNYITINNNAQGRISSITDTLGRVITLNYDGNANLLSITQNWTGQPSRQWVGFSWGTRTMQYSFTDSLLRGVIGTANNALIPVITQVTLNDTSHFTFEYTNSLQLSALKNYFGAIERNATVFTYQSPVGDAPRLVESRLSARNWTGFNNVPAQVLTTYSVAGDGACVMTASDGTVYKEYYGTGWQKGLTTLSEVWVGGEKKKWTTTAWTQDSTLVSYEVNPRVTETNVYDASGNRRRMTIDYGLYEQWGLPYGIREYAADGGTEIRQRFIDYHLGQGYLDRRIIGLVAQVRLTNVSSGQSKTTYDYDDPSRLHGVPAAATQHDVNYNLSFTTRGNVTAVSRWDVTDINNANKKLTNYVNYYNTGTPISTTDPVGHQSSITYADSFSDSVNRNTFAYPTTLTDEDGFSSTRQYNFDFGAVTRTQGPPPAGQAQGAIQTMTYNNLGQLERTTTTNNGAYKRFWYGPDYVASYATVNNVADELYSIQVVDGMGRVIGAAGNHPGSAGGYRLANTIYDQTGRAWKQSNPTEVNSSWVPTGDDAAGSYYTQQTYDWQGRPVVTTYPDLTTKEASYAGCGCAGGEVMTLTDEGNVINFAGAVKKRQKKIYSDVLGRAWKVELLNWDGSGPHGTGPNNTVYSTTVTTYNARDQVMQVRQYAGVEGNGTPQDTTTTYDGYGRIASKHIPEQNSGTSTVYTYNADDTVLSVTDARGAIATHSYNNRHLVTQVTYSAPVGITATLTATFGYDAAGNRTSMTDGFGSKSYTYDQLSRLMSETRTFTSVGTFALTYTYNLADQLKKITDASNTTINYGYDVAGQLTGVTGSDTLVGGVSNYASGFQYRAFGAVKQASVSTLNSTVSYNARMQTTNFNISGVVNENYTYNSDGSLKTVANTTDNNWDRAMFYDQVGRITFGAAGGDARQDFGPVPFLEFFGYNAFNDITYRETETWGGGYYYDTGSYTNHRRSGSTYDADGRVTAITTRTYTYDAAGRNTTLTGQKWMPSGFVATTTESGFDGDGVKVRENSGTSGSMTLRYFLQSTALGGAVVEELNGSGQKQMGYVFTPSGTELASQVAGANYVLFRQRSPVNTTRRGVFSLGGATRDEYDPVGARVRTSPNSPPDHGGGSAGEITNGSSGSLDGRTSSMANPLSGCLLDGSPVPCAIAMRGAGEASDVVYVDPFVSVAYRGRQKKPVWVEVDTSTASWTEISPGVYGMAIFPGPGGYFDWVEDPDDALELFTRPLSLQDRLTTTVKSEQWPHAPDPQAIRKNLEKMLSTGDCGTFISDLLDRMGKTKNNPRVKGSALDLYDMVTKQKGLVRGGLATQMKASATVDGQLIRPGKDGNASIHIGSGFAFMSNTYDEKAQAVASLDAFNVLHELVHLAGSKEYYTDRQVAVALSEMGNAGLPVRQKGESTRSFIGRNSAYFSDILRLKCPAL